MNISELRTVTATREHHYRNAVTLLQYFGNIITTRSCNNQSQNESRIKIIAAICNKHRRLAFTKYKTSLKRIK